MFEEKCSIYRDAKDNVGRYVDFETGECIQEMSIREFCLTDRWKPYVQDLRELVAVFGEKAKKVTWQQVCEKGLGIRYNRYYELMVDEIQCSQKHLSIDDVEKLVRERSVYQAVKKSLPGATLSALFSLWEDECVRKDGTKFLSQVSRRETHLKQHTGWLAIDIDLADNAHLSNFENVRMICRFRPEIALLMRSCSGTGYFGLVRLAYPKRHKEQFKALIREYASIGIVLDKQCGNIGRVRFASWDESENIYINEYSRPYLGVYVETAAPVAISRNPQYRHANLLEAAQGDAFWNDPRTRDRLVELCVEALVANHVNITEDYDDWVKAGWALKKHPYGEQLFHQLSACSSKYNEVQASHKWHQLGESKTVTGNYIIHKLKESLGLDVWKDIGRKVWNERSR